MKKTFKTFSLSLLAIGITASLASTAFAATPDARLRQMASNCGYCHGTDGHSRGGIPDINNLPRDYFVKQMQDFKSGVRPATVMHQHASGYTDSEFEAFARYFATR
jgi:cytochrome subunit of sulfide dehydrogenase